MEDKDHLKELLKNINQLNEPIDLEVFILNAIQEEESSKAIIESYKAKGFKALIVSGLLIVILGSLFSLPNSVRTFEYSIITYTSVILTLIVLFIQLEMGKTKIFNTLKNKRS